jgi:7-carboxy-7-deazaguanine synthase
MELPQINDQPPERRVEERDTLDVVDVFLTVQGEGPFVGRPAVFVRLAGCNLKCPACDTRYTDGRRSYTHEELVEKVRSLGQPFRKVGSFDCAERPLVVLTGGEPFRQRLQEFVRKLITADFRVQIETNGNFHEGEFPYYSDNVTLVVSPKNDRVHVRMRDVNPVYKYVLDAAHVDPDDGLPTAVLGNHTRPSRPPYCDRRGRVYVSPADSRDPAKNAANLQAAIQSCMKYGYTLSVQVHKAIGLP